MQNKILITSLIAAIALVAIIVPIAYVSQDNKMQSQANASTETTDSNSATVPHHDMVAMMTGQDSANSDQSSGSQDSDTQNTPLSKVSGNVTVDFTADPLIQTNKLATIQMHVKD